MGVDGCGPIGTYCHTDGKRRVAGCSGVRHSLRWNLLGNSCADRRNAGNARVVLRGAVFVSYPCCGCFHGDDSGMLANGKQFSNSTTDASDLGGVFCHGWGKPCLQGRRCAILVFGTVVCGNTGIGGEGYKGTVADPWCKSSRYLAGLCFPDSNGDKLLPEREGKSLLRCSGEYFCFWSLDCILDSRRPFSSGCRCSRKSLL